VHERAALCDFAWAEETRVGDQKLMQKYCDGFFGGGICSVQLEISGGVPCVDINVNEVYAKPWMGRGSYKGNMTEYHKYFGVQLGWRKVRLDRGSGGVRIGWRAELSEESFTDSRASNCAFACPPSTLNSKWLDGAAV
jgi:hypothetical protein